MLDSTVLTIGTALRRAQNAGMPVEVLVHGQWISGTVLGLDGHGALLDASNGDSAVVRLEDVSAVKVHPAEGRSRTVRPEEQEGWAEEARVHAPVAPLGVAALG